MNSESYDAIARQWDEVRTSLSEAEARIFASLVEDLVPGSRILDLGCGTGRPVAEYLVRHGFHVTGVDSSTKMLELARQRLPEQTWILSSMEDFESTGTYAATVAWDSFFHIPRGRHAAIWRQVRSALSVGSRFALTVGGSEHPAFTDSMFERTFFYDSHAPDTAMSILKEAGFRIVHHEFLNLPTAGRDKGRFAIVARAA